MKSYSIYVASAVVAVFALSSVGAAQMQHEMDPKMDHQLDKSIHCNVPMGEGVINALDVKKSTVNILHKPKDSVGFKEMAMDFTVLKPVNLSAFAVGERVHFLLKLEKGESHIIAAVCSLDIDEGAHQACMTKMHDDAMKLVAASINECAMEDMKPADGMDHGDMGKMDGDAEHDHSGHLMMMNLKTLKFRRYGRGLSRVISMCRLASATTLHPAMIAPLASSACRVSRPIGSKSKPPRS